jgi:hypothetical protein
VVLFRSGYHRYNVQERMQRQDFLRFMIGAVGTMDCGGEGIDLKALTRVRQRPMNALLRNHDTRRSPSQFPVHTLIWLQ